MTDWQKLWAEIDAACAAKGVDPYALRREVAHRECESGRWPEGEGLGSSDMNHLTVSAWQYDNAATLELIDELAWRAKTLADLKAAGVDLDKMREMFAPA